MINSPEIQILVLSPDNAAFAYFQKYIKDAANCDNLFKVQEYGKSWFFFPTLKAVSS